jgi:FixJ family two-component response regulator
MRRQIVAVVENDVGMLQSIERLLKAYQFEPALFTSAEAFLAGAAASTVNCLLLDIHLDGMSGIDLRRELAARGSDLPVIFMSAMDDDVIRDQTNEVGCVAYFRKPFSAQHLIAAINRAVAGG